MVSESPPVRWPIGSEPNRWAYIWLSPQGSNRDGINVKSLPAKMRLASSSSKPIFTAIERGERRCLQQRFFKTGFALAGDDDLAACVDDRLRAFEYEIDALLMDQPGHQGEQRSAGDCESKLLSYVVCVLGTFLPLAGPERAAQGCAGLRVPTLVDAVQDPREFVTVRSLFQNSFQTAPELGGRDLASIGLADGREMRRVDEPGLDEGHLVVELDAIHLKGGIRNAQP
jgi:hypothetical protein